ncbi:hypothetical protein IWZ03DRAFT_201502 [Phyllosticta citriasiana]|uniref:DUF6590 domain-containing protein n=1 Tax=Phyllosticta citriasiana TaxID=595635 RepID=A0ABR1KI01_9PEZI
MALSKLYPPTMMADPTREWVRDSNGRFFMYRWSSESQQWITVWQSRQRHDSVQSISAQVAFSLEERTPENLVRGTPGAIEGLDPSYEVQRRPRQFFHAGRMFSVLFTEPLGENARNVGDNVTTVIYDQRVFSQIRRFIVVQPKQGFCYAVLVSTYGNCGVNKPGVEPEAHAVVHTTNLNPVWLQGERERGMTKESIAVIPANDSVPLSPASRINFSLAHPIQYNVKVKDLGRVCDEDMPNFCLYWQTERDRTF